MDDTSTQSIPKNRLLGYSFLRRKMEKAILSGRIALHMPWLVWEFNWLSFPRVNLQKMLPLTLRMDWLNGSIHGNFPRDRDEKVDQ